MSPTKVAAAALLACALPVQADYYNGRKVLGWLDLDDTITQRGNRATPEEGFNSGLGVGYVVGIHDVVDGVVVCTPPDTTIRQLVGVVHAYLRSLPPKRLEEEADALIVEGLRRVFPCSRRSS